MKITKEKVPFTQVANEVLMNPKLSFRAKGLYAYLFSKPDGWDFSAGRMSQETTENRKTIQKDLKVLIEAGYLERKRLPTGKVTYTLKYSSLSPREGLGEPKAQVRSTPWAQNGLVSNKEGESNKDNTFAGTSPAKSSKATYNPLGAEILKAFEEIDPKNKSYYGNKNQRSACDFLIEEYGLERILKVVKDVLPKTNGKPYYPMIVSPWDLKEKGTKLKDAIERDKKRSKSKSDERLANVIL